MLAYPENVRSPGQTGSRRGPAKPTLMTRRRRVSDVAAQRLPATERIATSSSGIPINMLTEARIELLGADVIQWASFSVITGMTSLR
jgi:hypothetical protein